MNRNHSADGVKFFACLAVVLMHVSNYLPATGRATYWNYYWYFPILDLGVPLFFAMAGYFIAPRVQDEAYLLKYGLRILEINIAYTIFYLLFYWPLDTMEQLLRGQTFGNAIQQHLTELKWTDFLTGVIGSEHLWYLMALFIAVMVFYLLRHWSLSFPVIMTISTVTYLLTFTPVLQPLMDNVLIYGGFVKGLFYLLIGYTVANKKLTLPYPKSMIVASVVALILVDTFSDNLLFREVFLALSTFSIVVFISNNPGKANFFSKVGGQYSLGIYLLHILFVGGFNVL